MTGSNKIDIELVGGGTLALEKIKRKRPQIIIAIACERELIDGIRRVSGFPVWAINNQRHDGPCHNTTVELEELERILKINNFKLYPELNPNG